MKTANLIKLCTHDMSGCSGRPRPEIDLLQWGTICTYLLEHPSYLLSSLAHFEAEQPSLTNYLLNCCPCLNRDGQCWLKIQTIAIWRAFKQQFPNLRPVTEAEIANIHDRILQHLGKPPLCLCELHQRSLMGVVVGATAGLASEGSIPIPTANSMGLAMLTVNEAFDRASYIPPMPEAKSSKT